MMTLMCVVIVILLPTVAAIPIFTIWLVVSVIRETRDTESYWFMRRHTATFNGKSVEFKSYYRRGTLNLRSDAISACQQAGIYERGEDLSAILIDGEPISAW